MSDFQQKINNFDIINRLLKKKKPKPVQASHM